jgi:uncharacterized protein
LLRYLVRLAPSASASSSPPVDADARRRGPDRAVLLRVVRSIAASIGVRVVNPKWTSYGALEVDVFAGTGPDFETFMGAVEPLGEVEFTRNLSEAPRPLSPQETVEEARSLFNQERFWEGHEVLESLWRVAAGEEKSLIQGIILVCAAYVHLQKDEPAVALGVALRAVPKLVWTGRSYYGIDVDAMRKTVAQMTEEKALTLFKI